MVVRFFSVLFKSVFRIITVVLVIIAIVSLIDSRFIFQDYKSSIGTKSDTMGSTTVYNGQTRKTHIQYLKTFNYQNLNIRYIDHGPKDGNVIVLLHGTPTSSWLYRKIIPGLAAQGYRVIAPDMAGFGASSKTNMTMMLSTEQQAKRLNALMRSLEIERFALAGHDQGSLWLQHYLISFPQKVNALILFNGIYDRDGFHPPQWFGEKNKITTLTARSLGSIPLGRVFTYGLMIGGLKDLNYATPTMINGYLIPQLDGMDETYYQFISSFKTLKTNVARYKKEIRQLDNKPPVQVIRGEHDTILVGKEQLPVIKDIWGIEAKNIHFLSESGHFPQEEQPDMIVSLISGFLKTVPQ